MSGQRASTSYMRNYESFYMTAMQDLSLCWTALTDNEELVSYFCPLWQDSLKMYTHSYLNLLLHAVRLVLT